MLFQHDGCIALDESHVRGIASLGASTKGLAHVGFMGVGFKSVFARFRTVFVSGFGFRFKFDVGVHHGDIGQRNTPWFDTLLPHWDDDAPDQDAGYTTSIRLERPVSERTVAKDIERISSPEDQTPLAVLALRGLKQIRVDDIEWDLDVAEDVVEVRRHNGESTSNWRWKSFVSRYRPDDDAMRRFLEVRQETHDQVDDSGERITREVVGLVPLDSDGCRTCQATAESTRRFLRRFESHSDFICRRTGSSMSIARICETSTAMRGRSRLYAKFPR